MRLRRRSKKTIDITPEAVASERLEQQEADNLEKKDSVPGKGKKQTSKEPQNEKIKRKKSKKSNDKENKTAKFEATPGSLLRKIVQSPNFGTQIMVIIFSLLSDNVPMNRPLENMTSAIDKVRNISEVLTTTMQSVKVATDVPNQIRRLLK